MLTIDTPSPMLGTGSALLADGQDVALLRATVVDAKGVKCGASTANVTFSVTVRHEKKHQNVHLTHTHSHAHTCTHILARTHAHTHTRAQIRAAHAHAHLHVHATHPLSLSAIFSHANRFCISYGAPARTC